MYVVLSTVSGSFSPSFMSAAMEDLPVPAPVAPVRLRSLTSPATSQASDEEVIEEIEPEREAPVAQFAVPPPAAEVEEPGFAETEAQTQVQSKAQAEAEATAGALSTLGLREEAKASGPLMGAIGAVMGFGFGSGAKGKKKPVLLDISCFCFFFVCTCVCVCACAYACMRTFGHSCCPFRSFWLNCVLSRTSPNDTRASLAFRLDGTRGVSCASTWCSEYCSSSK